MKQTLLLALACHLLVAVAAQSPPGFKWVKTITYSPPNSSAEVFDFCTDPPGNSYVYGIFTGTINFGGDVTLQALGAVEGYFVAKYAPNGVLGWAQKIVAPNGGAIYTIDMNPGGISADNLGNVYISGQLTNVALNFGNGVLLQRNCQGAPMCSDLFVAKFNAVGEAQWATNGSGNAGTFQTATRLVTDAEGSVYIAGNYGGQVLKFGNQPPYDNLEMDAMYMARFTSAGQPAAAWFFGNGDGYTQLDHLAMIAPDQVIATGYYDGSTLQFGNGISLEPFGSSSASNYFVAAYNPEGNAQWAYNLHAEDYMDVLDVAADTLGRPYVVVDFKSGLNSSNQEVATTPIAGNFTGILLHLTDSVFHPVVAVHYSGAAYPVANVAVDKHNRFFISGSFSDAQLPVGDVVLVNANKECDDILLLSGTVDSTPLNWVRSAGGIGCEGILSAYFGRVLATDQAGNLYAVGSFHEVLDLDNFSKNGDGLFVTKLGTALVPTNTPPAKEQAMDIVPNPSSGNFSIAGADLTDPIRIMLYDVQGRICYQRLAKQAVDLDFHLSIPAGVYTLEWRSKTKIGQQKVMIIR